MKKENENFIDLPADGWGLSFTKQTNGDSHTVHLFFNKKDVPELTEEICNEHIPLSLQRLNDYNFETVCQSEK